MSDLIDYSAFAAVIADPRFIAAVMVSALSGLVRGFSGFGSALIYIPLVSAIYEPRVAATTLLLIDFTSSAPFSIREFSRCNWREVAPITIVASLMNPIGTLALVFADPIVLRWVISVLVLVLLAVLISGWRYHGKPTLPAMAAVGTVSGLGSGAVQIAGPPVIIFWLGGRDDARTVRANLMVFFILISVTACVTYFTQGLFTANVRGAVALPWPAVPRRDVDRRALLPHGVRHDVSAGRLRDRGGFGAGQPAAVRQAVSLGANLEMTARKAPSARSRRRRRAP